MPSLRLRSGLRRCRHRSSRKASPHLPFTSSAALGDCHTADVTSARLRSQLWPPPRNAGMMLHLVRRAFPPPLQPQTARGASLAVRYTEREATEQPGPLHRSVIEIMGHFGFVLPKCIAIVVKRAIFCTATLSCIPSNIRHALDSVHAMAAPRLP